MYEPIGRLLVRFRRGLRQLVSDPRDWFVLVGDRLVIATLLTMCFGLVLLPLLEAELIVTRDTTQMLYVFQALVGGNITLVTIVLSINQLVLSREFKTPGELEEHIQNTIDYRTRVEETANRNRMSVTPTAFLSELLGSTKDTAERLGESVEEQERERLVDEVDALASHVVEHTGYIDSVLEYSQDGIFSALAVTLETNYSHQLNEAHRIQVAYEDDLSPDTFDALDELIECLKQIDIARQYFKSIYTQSELSRLSRILLYVGIPAVASALIMLAIYAGTTDPPVGVYHLHVVVPVVVTVGVAPLAVMFSFVLRIASIAQQTVAITPFTTPAQESLSQDR